MTAIEHLRIMSRCFPHSKQLVVTTELLKRYEAELVPLTRYYDTSYVVLSEPKVERVGHLVVYELPLCYRNARLVMVDNA